MRALVLLSLVIALAACGKPDNAPGPGGVTVGEARALDEAATMIEAQRLPPAATMAPAVPPVPVAQSHPPPPQR